MPHRYSPPCLIYSFYLRNSSGRTPCERIKRTLPSLKRKGAIGLAFSTVQRRTSTRLFQISSILQSLATGNPFEHTTFPPAPWHTPSEPQPLKKG